MATTAVKTKADAALSDRMHKKPRLSPATSVPTAPPTTSASSAGRHKSGLLPPTVSASRPHFAFGSRRPLSGKENAPVNTPSTATKPSKPTATDTLKKPESDTKAALNRRPKPRLPPTPTNKKSQTSAPSTPASSDVDATASADEAPVVQTTPPTNKTPVVVLSPVKPVRFEVTSATDPDFWKCRQQFARTAMLQLKDLEDRLNALTEAPSLPTF